MPTDNFNPKNALQVTRIIYFALLTGSLFYLAVVLFIADDKFVFNADFKDPLFLALLVISIIAIPSSFLYAKRALTTVIASEPLEKKFPVYQTALIIRMASCEGIALFSAVCLLLTNNLFSILFFSFAFIIMIRYYPTPDKIGNEINLTQIEISQFH